MQFSLFEGEDSGLWLEPAPFSLHTYPDTTESDDEDTCSALREADYQEALWRFLGPDVAPYDTSAALEWLVGWDVHHRDDPFHPRNLTRYHPLHDDTLMTRCLPTGEKSVKQKIWVLISAHRLEWAAQFAWNVNNDKAGGRYPRRKKRKNGKTYTVYLYREIMRQMLTENPTLRAEALRKFRLKPTGHTAHDVAAVLAIAVVHHRNHQPEDCRDENLVLATPSENRIQGCDTPGASGFVGVHRVPTGTRWGYRALVTFKLEKGRYRKAILGTFGTAQLALLARCLFLLTHPSYLPHGYTPREAEASTWAAAKGMIEHRPKICAVFGEIKALPKDLKTLLAAARKSHRRGRRATVRPRV